MQNKRWSWIALGACFLATPAWAQTPPAADTSAPPPAGNPVPQPAPNGGAPVAPPAAAAPAPAPAPVPPPAPAPVAPPPSPAAAGGTTVTIGTAPAGNPIGNAPLDSGPQPVTGKFATTLYGFAELDAIHDSTQSFSEAAGNGLILRDDKSYGGNHARTQFGARYSRLGLKVNAPALGALKASGIIEFDFFGNQPSNPPTTSESAFFTGASIRMRHFALKLETPVVDIIAGQYWNLFGWQSGFAPATVQIQGVPGQLNNRTPQFRVGKTIKAGDAAFDIAVAAARPVQRNSGTPDGQAGLKFTYAGLKTVHTTGAAGTNADGFSIGVSGIARRFVLADLAGGAPALHSHRQGENGMGLSIDGLVPVIPATLEKRDNALALSGSFVTGTGINDIYSGLTGGVTIPSPPNPDMVTPAPAYTADIDPGLVTFDKQGNLHSINWQSYIVGIQYYLPVNGKIWVSANYSAMKSSNITRYVAPGSTTIFNRSQWWDVNLFVDPIPAVRFGLEYAKFYQRYGDLKTATNDRVQFSSFFIF